MAESSVDGSGQNVASGDRGLGDGRWIHLRALAVVGVCALLAHVTVLGSVLAFDDVHSVRDNPHLRGGFAALARAFVDPQMFSGESVVMYRPTVVASLVLSYMVGSGAIWVFHLADLLLHAATALMVYAVAVGLRVRPFGAVVGACVFAVHPLATEAIHFVNGRSDQFVALAGLAALAVHLRGVRGRLSDWLTGLSAALCCAVACGSKETAIVVPALLLVSEGLAARSRRLGPVAMALRVLPSIAVVAAWLVVRKTLLGKATVALPKLTQSTDLHTGAGRDLTTQLSTMAGEILPQFSLQGLFPFGLCIDPAVQFLHSPWSWSVVCGGLGLALATGWLLVGGWRERAPARVLGVAIVWASASPWILIPLNSPALEHRLYFPLAGAAVALASLVRRPRAGSVVRLGSRSLASRQVALAGTAAVLVMFAGLSTARGRVYRSEEALWTATRAANPGSRHALISLANVLFAEGSLRTRQSGDPQHTTDALLRASELLVEAAARWPTSRPALEAVVETELRLGERGRAFLAVVLAERLVELRSKDPFQRLRLARALASAGMSTGEAKWFDAGVAAALTCLQVADPKGLVYRTAAKVRLQQGDPRAARELLDTSVARGLDHAEVLIDRARVNLKLGDRDAMKRDLLEVRRRDPFDPLLMQFVAEQAQAQPEGVPAGAPR